MPKSISARERLCNICFRLYKKLCRRPGANVSPLEAFGKPSGLSWGVRDESWRGSNLHPIALTLNRVYGDTIGGGGLRRFDNCRGAIIVTLPKLSAAARDTNSFGALVCDAPGRARAPGFSNDAHGHHCRLVLVRAVGRLTSDKASTHVLASTEEADAALRIGDLFLSSQAATIFAER